MLSLTAQVTLAKTEPHWAHAQASIRVDLRVDQEQVQDPSSPAEHCGDPHCGDRHLGSPPYEGPPWPQSSQGPLLSRAPEAPRDGAGSCSQGPPGMPLMPSG